MSRNERRFALDLKGTKGRANYGASYLLREQVVQIMGDWMGGMMRPGLVGKVDYGQCVVSLGRLIEQEAILMSGGFND